MKWQRKSRRLQLLAELTNPKRLLQPEQRRITFRRERTARAPQLCLYSRGFVAQFQYRDFHTTQILLRLIEAPQPAANTDSSICYDAPEGNPLRTHVHYGGLMIKEEVQMFPVFRLEKKNKEVTKLLLKSQNSNVTQLKILLDSVLGSWCIPRLPTVPSPFLRSPTAVLLFIKMH